VPAVARALRARVFKAISFLAHSAQIEIVRRAGSRKHFWQRRSGIKGRSQFRRFLALSAPFVCDSVEQDSNADAVVLCVINEVVLRKRINASRKDDPLVIADTWATNQTRWAGMVCVKVVYFFLTTPKVYQNVIRK
jgi:hypothetical protein